MTKITAIFFPFDLSPRAIERKTKINKLDLNKHKSFCTAQTTIAKRQPTEWGKIFASHLSDKGLISKIGKELIQLNGKITSQWKKWTEDLTFFPKKAYRWPTDT